MKRSGLCLYYKENILSRHNKTEYFSQCLLCRISYRSVNQNNNEFNEFLSNFERLLNYVKQLKSSFLLILDDFNAQSKFWCLDDITTHEDSKIDSLTTNHGLHQLISQLTHLLSTYSNCIDLIFAVVYKETRSSKTTRVQFQVMNIYLRLKIYLKTLVGH